MDQPIDFDDPETAAADFLVKARLVQVINSDPTSDLGFSCGHCGEHHHQALHQANVEKEEPCIRISSNGWTQHRKVDEMKTPISGGELHTVHAQAAGEVDGIPGCCLESCPASSAKGC
jgi:hypothetical protein